MRISTKPLLARIAAIDQAVRSGSWPNAGTLGRQLEVSPRTIQRDFLYLRDRLGAPLAFDPVRNGYRYTQADFSLPFFRLTEGELVAFFLAERLMQQYRDSPFARDLATAFAKLTAALPDEVSIHLADVAETYSFRVRPTTTGDVKRFQQLLRAVREGQQLELTYWSASRDETCQRVVDPYHLASLEGDWYLIGRCHLREALRIFVPSRIRSLRPTGKKFERPADFRINDYLNGSFRVFRGDGPPQAVRLRFAPEVARYVVEKEWHPSQTIERKRDGGIVLTLRVSHLLEVRRWVMSWGSECEVLEPAELKQEVHAEMRKALER